MQVTIEVDNRLRIGTATLPSEVVYDLSSEFEHYNPMRAKLERMGLSGYALRKEPQTIQSWAIEGPHLTFPRGGLGRVRAVLAANGIDWRVVDNRTHGRGPSGLPPHRIVLRDYQEQIVQQAIEQENCVIRAPTGSGKTSAALGLAARLGLPTLVIVWTGGLRDQWVRRVETEFGLDRSEIGIIGGGTRRIRAITIGMQQTIIKCVDQLADVFGLVIADELQRYAARTFFEGVDRFPARYRIGFSADERRKDRKEFLIYDCFGDIVVDVDPNELIERGVVHDVEVRVVPTDFDCDWYRVLNEKFKAAEKALEENKQRIPKGLVAERLQSFDRLVDEMMVDPDRCRLAIDIAAGEIEAGEQVVMMSHRREQCRRLDADLSARSIRCGLMLGGAEDASVYKSTLAALLDGSLRAAAGTYQAIGQGIDLPSVSVGVCCSPIANSRDGKSFFKQVRGRLCRAAHGKTGARIYYLLDRKVYGLEPLRNLLRWNTTVVVRDGAEWIPARAWLKRETEP